MGGVETRFRVDGKVAIVTGAGSGNGRACAVALAEAGAAVCVADLPSADSAGTVATIRAGGGHALAVDVDVRNRGQVEAMVASAVQRFGRLDILVNNAGITRRSLLLDVTEADFDDLIGVNLKGPLFCMQAAVPHLRAAGGGSIVNVISISPDLLVPGIGIYATSKAGLRTLTEAMALELADDRIRVNGICPGLTLTGMNRERLSQPGELERNVARIPLGRAGLPDDHVGAVLLLASEASSWMTGSTITVDGGRLLGH